MQALVGRAGEHARLDAVVTGAAAGSGGALALVGEPGIGKSALLSAAVAQANGRVRVLTATGAEAERDLPYAALLSLLRPTLDRIGTLPAVQARALEGALAVGPPAPGDRLVVHAAALGLLSAAAAERPVLAIVDDAHWLDEASAAALLFAARRLDGEPVALLLALRPDEGRWLDLRGVEELAVAGLSRKNAGVLLRRVTPGRTVPPEVVERLHAVTAGNPLALLEAPLHVPPEQLSGRDPLADPLTIGPGVQAGYRRRLARLPLATRTALLLAAASGAEPLDRILRAADDVGVGLSDLEPAEADRLVEVTADAIRFRHPLVRAVAYQDAPAPARRRVHRALAAHTTGARRASHLWASAAGPDPRAAGELEAAATDARQRTGWAAAALAMERAARLSAPGNERAGRLLVAAQDRLVAGEAARAADLAREALAEAGELALVAELKALLGTIDMLAGSLEEGFHTLSAAGETIADSDPDRAAWMFATAALTCFMAARVPLGLGTSTRAYACAQRAGGRTEQIVGVLHGCARILAGYDEGDGERPLIDAWPDVFDDRILLPGAPHLLAPLHTLAWLERYDDVDAFAARVEAMAADRGAVGALPLLRSGQLETDLRRGDWSLARARASEALRLAAETGQSLQRAIPICVLARIEAAMGLEKECRASVQQMLELALPAGGRSMAAFGEAALGLLELGLGRAARAVDHLDGAARLCEVGGQRDPSVVQHLPDRVEAHLRAGDVEGAEAALRQLEAMAERTRRPWPLATAARCRGLLADDDAFDEYFERAYALHGPAASPFELARTELCHGERLRRARRAREAREPLRAALERFEGLGAAPWAARARTALRAAGGGANAPRGATTRTLTPQELEVALAVARGGTNREVAAAMFVSPKTIEVHLSRIFRKLQVRSRTELALLLADSE